MAGLSTTARGSKRSAKKAPVAKRASKKKTRSAALKKVAAKSAKKKAPAKKQVATKAKVARKSATTAKSGLRPKASAAKKRVGPRAKRAPALSSNNKAPASFLDPIQFPEDSRPFPKTHLVAKELREFRALLHAKRAELMGDVGQLAAEALHSPGGGEAEHSAMPIHMADLGTDNWEQELTLGLLASEQRLVREIDEALKRIKAKSYGVCLETQAKISTARLRAKPWAKYCIEYARAREEGRAV